MKCRPAWSVGSGLGKLQHQHCETFWATDRGEGGFVGIDENAGAWRERPAVPLHAAGEHQPELAAAFYGIGPGDGRPCIQLVTAGSETVRGGGDLAHRFPMLARERAQRGAVVGEFHVASAGVPAVAEGKVVEAPLPRRQRAVGSPGASEVDRPSGYGVGAEAPRPVYHDLELVGLMVMRADDGIGVLLDQECHGIDSTGTGWFLGAAAVAVGANVACEPEAGAVGAGAPACGTDILGRGDHWHCPAPFPTNAMPPR